MATARLRVIHAAATAGNVDVYAAGATTPALPNVPYGAASAYLELPAASIAFDIRPAGAAASTPPLYTTPSVTLAAGASYSVIAAGDPSAQATAESRFRVLALQDEFGPAVAGQARVRVVHAGFDAPAVAIDVGDDGTAEVATLARFADTGAAGVPLPGGAALQVGIRTTGATGARVTAFTTPNLGDGTQWYVIATGQLSRVKSSEQGFSLLAVNATTAGAGAFIEQNPRVSVLHAGGDAPAVDVFAGPNEIVSNLSFGNLATVQVPPGNYALDVFAATQGSTRPTSNPAFTYNANGLAGGEHYLSTAAFYLTAGTGEQAFNVLTTRDTFGIPDAPKVIAVHAAGNAPAVDIGTTTGTTLNTPAVIANLARGVSSAVITLPTTPFTLGIAATGSTATVYRTAISFPTPTAKIFVAAGTLNPAVGSPRPAFRVLVVDALRGTLEPWTVSTALGL